MIQRLLQFIKDFWRGGAFGAARSKDWSFFKRDYGILHPKKCSICGNKKCSLHHKQSFATHPELELLKENVCWLCDGWGTLQHHRGVGHLGSFLSINENLDLDIKIWKEKFDTRPKWSDISKKWIY